MDRVLIVEDESIIALNIEHSLTRLGYQVVGMAGTSAEALALAEEKRPDVVLMDINLGPGGDGVDTAGRIRQQRDTAVIYLTAYSEDATLRRAGATQPYGYLIKPFSERELHATIQMAMERHRHDLAIMEAEERLRLALQAAEMGTWEVDPDSGHLRSHPYTDALFGIDGAAADRSCKALIARVLPEDRVAVRNAYARAVSQDATVTVDFRSLREDGTHSWVRAQGRSFGTPRGGRRLIGVARDITALRLDEATLRQAAVVFDSAREAIFIADGDYKLVAVNAAFSALTGRPAEDVVGRRIGRWLLRPPSALRTLDVLAELAQHGHWQGELMGLRHGGEGFPVWLNLTLVRDEHDGPDQVVGIFSDIGALRRAEEKLIRLAHYDPLTGLPNRLLAMDRLNHAISRARRHGWRAAVIMIDLDHFKYINDTLGHAAGDELLRIVGGRLKPGVRDEDTVARLGGDEFIVVLDHVSKVEDIAAIVVKLMQRLAAPLSVQGRDIRSGASMGISIYPDDAQDREALVRAADTAMYAAKEDGRNRAAYFAPEMTAKLARFVAAERDLWRGLAQGELRVYYQPQVALDDGRLVGLEALVRWQHPERGLLGAGEVIPVAETGALIVEVGTWVLNDVCRTIRDWLDAGLVCPRVAINVSVQQLKVPDFPDQVARALLDAGISADRLEIELTESTLQQESVCLPAMQALYRLGVALAIDDFGTGYSSLASLKRLPVTRCKMDHAFVSGIATDPGDAAVAGAIVDLGHRLGMRITAEGVETDAQFAVLRALGCDDAQGYLFGQALPQVEIERLIRTLAPGAVRRSGFDTGPHTGG